MSSVFSFLWSSSKPANDTTTSESPTQATHRTSQPSENVTATSTSTSTSTSTLPFTAPLPPLSRTNSTSSLDDFEIVDAPSSVSNSNDGMEEEMKSNETEPESPQSSLVLAATSVKAMVETPSPAAIALEAPPSSRLSASTTVSSRSCRLHPTALPSSNPIRPQPHLHPARGVRPYGAARFPPAIICNSLTTPKRSFAAVAAAASPSSTVASSVAYAQDAKLTESEKLAFQLASKISEECEAVVAALDEEPLDYNRRVARTPKLTTESSVKYSQLTDRILSVDEPSVKRVKRQAATAHAAASAHIKVLNKIELTEASDKGAVGPRKGKAKGKKGRKQRTASKALNRVRDDKTQEAMAF